MTNLCTSVTVQHSKFVSSRSNDVAAKMLCIDFKEYVSPAAATQDFRLVFDALWNILKSGKQWFGFPAYEDHVKDCETSPNPDQMPNDAPDLALEEAVLGLIFTTSSSLKCNWPAPPLLSIT